MDFEPTPPEMAEDIRRCFDEEAFFAAMEEVLKPAARISTPSSPASSGRSMVETDSPALYQVVYSGFVERRLEELAEEALARGDGVGFAASLAKFRRLLALYPQFGDPLIDLTAEPGIIHNGIIRPLSMRYGVLEERKLVLVVARPVLPPMDRPDASAGE